eukprot:TCALIF_06322-PA protein Name:"Similar to ubtf-a Nucleolar transcription factor 1-A (Xenopus laevis)" AED:0.17 eAED:0.17 QI:0/-1/0/1/-1/1/1/0/518
MGKKRKSVTTGGGEAAEKPPPAKKPASVKKKKKMKKEEAESSDDERPDSPIVAKKSEVKIENMYEVNPAALPPSEVMNRLIDRIEHALPKEDNVKYDSRAKKLNWESLAGDGLDAFQCEQIWYYIQERIRRFRILSEMIPDARTWVSHPWTNFYKSKDHNRHPNMPKKPLSMYMLFYSEQREEILKTNPSMSMPEVAKACSEKYQKLSEKKKNKYKSRCDIMRKEYEEKLERFYTDYPDMRPIKSEKSKKAAAAAAAHAAHAAAQVAAQNLNMQQSNANNLLYQQTNPHQYQPQPQMMAPPLNLNPNPAGMTTTIDTMQLQPHHPQQITLQQQQQPQQAMPPGIVGQTQPSQGQPPMVKSEDKAHMAAAYPHAPERPSKPFDLYFKSVVDEHLNDQSFDRSSVSEKCRAEWKVMKLKKKAKWIRKAADKYREYEELVSNFIKDNPGYIPPEKKNFLTQEDQKILDKFMGRPEKPPSSAYSLFSKEMLNNEEIKMYPSKERMAQISHRWKLISQEQKDR